MFRFSRRHQRPEGVEGIWGVCSMLLDYPTPELVASLDDLDGVLEPAATRRGVRGPAARDAAEHLRGLLAFLRETPLEQVQAEYVETFDHTRKCAPYLTYFTFGDTRRRGVALVQFKQAYRKSGAEFDDSGEELPDHLCVVLQFGALVDADAAWRLLLDHRAGVEMLRLALTSWRRPAAGGSGGATGSPWAAVLDAVCATLPELKGEEADAVRRLVEQGPPAEEVGLDGYAADPRLSGSPGHTSGGPGVGPQLISPTQIPVLAGSSASDTIPRS